MENSHDFTVLYDKLDIRGAIISTIVPSIIEWKESFHHDKDLVIIGILTGAAFCTVDISRALGARIPHKTLFMTASSYDGMQRKKVRDVSLCFDPKHLKNAAIVVIDELLDTGHTLKRCISKIAHHTDRKSIISCVVMQKYGPEQVIKADIVGIDNVPDQWLVGYGLDNDGFHRETIKVYKKLI